MGSLTQTDVSANAAASLALGRLADVRLYRYRLPLRQPLPLRGVTLHEREGLLVRLADEDGRHGWGEAAPLPGFSEERLAEAEAQLQQVKSEWPGRPFSLDWTSVRDGFVQELWEAGLAPSVRFGLEEAAWSLCAAASGKGLAEMMTSEPTSVVPLNALLVGSGEAVLEEARRVREAGYRAVKLKVGRTSVEEEIELVRALRGVLGPDVALRLDANRAWTSDQAAAFAQGTAACDLEYVEEPLADSAGLPRLVEAHGLPVALDESLVGMPVDELERHRYARAVVLKPTLLGGLARALEIARQATALGLTSVVSASFESGVGLLGLVALAAGTGAAPAGLDTYRHLAADVLASRLPLEAAQVDADALLTSVWEVDEERLEEV